MDMDPSDVTDSNLPVVRPKRKCSILPTFNECVEGEAPSPRKLKTSSPATQPNITKNGFASTSTDTFRVVPLRVSAPEEDSCKLSDNLADGCRTFCKVCGLSFTLSGMRSHTLSKHELQITRYKELYGPFEVIENVFHKCHICGKIVLLDNDALGGHIKGTHKMKEKDYKERFMVYAHQSEGKVESSKTNSKIKKTESVRSKPQYDFKTSFPDYEYSCNLKHCELCEHGGAEVILDTLDSSKVRSELDVIEEIGEPDSVDKNVAEDCKSVDDIEEPVVQVKCLSGQGGWSKKFLPTDILVRGTDLENSEFKDEFKDEFESSDYSDESLIEATEDSSSESSEDDSEEE
eukprot:GFUD01043985.1.p1 GENE.GFUD01043985.1~~GFUD01043985.1.p1  ORF type:complete len:347 (-),score=77.20 GFUD01043985.1:115-1155(-)